MMTGWTPAAFKPSQGARSKAAQARAEGFMDEGDLKEATEVQIVERTSGFSGIGSTQGELGLGVEQVTVMDLSTPAVQDTMGAKLLKRMRWREGQGIGPNIRRKAATDDAVDDKTYSSAPAGAVAGFTQKNDSEGLGYVGEDRLPQGKESEIEHLAAKEEERKGDGFGVGVLNDDSEDDEDPYEIRPKSTCNRVIGSKRKNTIVKKPVRHGSVSKKVSRSKSETSLLKCGL